MIDAKQKYTVIKLGDKYFLSILIELPYQFYAQLYHGEFRLIFQTWDFGYLGELYMNDLQKKNSIGRFKLYKRFEIVVEEFKYVMEMFDGIEKGNS